MIRHLKDIRKKDSLNKENKVETENLQVSKMLAIHKHI